MKTLALFAFVLTLGSILTGCAGNGDLGKIGPDYQMNRTYQSGQVQNMHSSIQRGTF